MKTQGEFLATANVFNLVSDRGEDGERVERERLQAEAARRAATEYARKMQRLFDEQCPGFVGGDMPGGECAKGEVLIESGCAKAAVDWLKRRFSVKQEIGIALTGELRIIFATRRKPNRNGTQRRVRVSFQPVEQFDLPL